MSNLKKLEIFNLEFPSYIEEFKIGDYLFKRVENYKEAFDGMMHLHNSAGGEFNTQIKFGTHQITATVEIPKEEEKAILPFSVDNTNEITQLDDILLLLTIFTNRNVFKKNWEDDDSIAVISDHRIHSYGSKLILSTECNTMYKNKITGELKTEQEIRGISVSDYNLIDISFENTLNKVYNLILSRKWQGKYNDGFFLFLFQSAIQRQVIEISFISCWTIWEHIFAVRNIGWLDSRAIERMGGDKKIAFILNKYFLKNIDDNEIKYIKEIKKIRNRLIHSGKKTKGSNKEMKGFINLTEELVVIILGLKSLSSIDI